MSDSEPNRIFLCRRDEISPGEVKNVSVGGRSIAVVRSGDEFYALRNSCAHQGAQLSEGRLTGTMLPSEVGEYRYGRKGEILRCPWHNWEYDIKTGCTVHDSDKRVATYSVVCDMENVYLETAKAPPGRE